MLHVFYLRVAYVSNLCCKYFIWVLHMLHTYVASVPSGCCICFQHVFLSCFRHMLQVFQLFWTYVANISSRCCKSRPGVAHVAVDLICSNHLLQLLGPPTCRGCGGGVSGRRKKTLWTLIEMELVRDTERCGTWSGHATRSGVRPHVK
jgi:hypothetical protein